MSRRSFLVAVGIVVVLALSVGTALTLLLHYEPGHYRRAGRPPGKWREQRSQDFYSEFSEVWSAMEGEKAWDARFTDEQINSYLSEGFIQSGLYEKLLPEGITDPRVQFEPERMRLAFRYRSRFLTTVVSIGLRVWLPRTEKNVVALRLEELKAGLVPFSAQWLLERISEAARQYGIEVNWYRHEGYPVALLRFQADRPRPTLELLAVQFEEGVLTIHGRSQDARVRADLPGIHLARKSR